VLTQKKNGFVFLDVSNDFIKMVAPLLEIPGKLSTPATAAKSVGAHISVFEEDDGIVVQELGMPFTFYVKEVRSVVMHTRDGMKKLWMIAVDAPELEKLRESYGLSPKLKGHDFHITLGKQLPQAPSGWESDEELSAYHYSDEPTKDLSTTGDFVVVDAPELIATAAKINAVAKLKMKKSGYAYLDVSNVYIDAIAAQLPVEGSFEPLATKAKSLGAHISVLDEDEVVSRQIWELAEVGKWFTFEVKELRYIDTSTKAGASRLWILAVDAPALQRMRMDYGLKPKLHSHDFHITIGSEGAALKED
jgi:hypothetical protein